MRVGRKDLLGFLLQYPRLLRPLYMPPAPELDEEFEGGAPSGAVYTEVDKRTRLDWAHGNPDAHLIAQAMRDDGEDDEPFEDDIPLMPRVRLSTDARPIPHGQRETCFCLLCLKSCVPQQRHLLPKLPHRVLHGGR